MLQKNFTDNLRLAASVGYHSGWVVSSLQGRPLQCCAINPASQRTKTSLSNNKETMKSNASWRVQKQFTVNWERVQQHSHRSNGEYVSPISSVISPRNTIKMRALKKKTVQCNFVFKTTVKIIQRMIQCCFNIFSNALKNVRPFSVFFLSFLVHKHDHEYSH